MERILASNNPTSNNQLAMKVYHKPPMKGIRVRPRSSMPSLGSGLNRARPISAKFLPENELGASATRNSRAILTQDYDVANLAEKIPSSIQTSNYAVAEEFRRDSVITKLPPKQNLKRNSKSQLKYFKDHNEKNVLKDKLLEERQ